MDVQEIIDYASKQLLKKFISLEDGIEWINDALASLNTDAGVFGEHEINTALGIWNSLPDDFLKVSEVRDSKGYDYYDWEADGSRIRFWRAGSYIVRYYRRPVGVVDGNSVPDCKSDLHRALAYYIAFRFWKRNFPGEEPTQDWFNEYLARVIAAKSKQKKNTGIKVVR